MSEGCKSESAQTYLGPFYQIVVYVMQILPVNHISWEQIVVRRHLKTNRKLRCKGWEMGECHAIPRHVVPDELCFVSDFALQVKHCPEVLHGRALELLLSLTFLVPQLCAYTYCSAPATQVGLCPPFQLCLLASHPKQWPSGRCFGPRPLKLCFAELDGRVPSRKLDLRFFHCCLTSVSASSFLFACPSPNTECSD